MKLVSFCRLIWTRLWRSLSPLVPMFGLEGWFFVCLLFMAWMGCVSKVHALPIVVTPGSSAAYLYFPAQTSTQGSTNNPSTSNTSSTLTLVGVGGVSVTKAGGWLGYTLTHAASGSSCGVTCALGQFNTGSGFVTLTASRPSTFTDSGDVPLSNCTAVLNCTTWVSTNTSLVLKMYPNCFEGDYKLNYQSTCTTSTSPLGINNFYATNLTAVGLFAGVLASNVLVYNLMPTLAAWESVGDFYGNKYGVAPSSSSGAQNKIFIQATYTPSSIEDTCTALGAAWVVPSSDELQLFVARLPLKFYWTSNDVNQNNSTAVSSAGQISSLLKWTPLGMTCVHYYPLS